LSTRNTLGDCRIIELPRIGNPRGDLSFLEGSRHVPFDIRRVFYVYDVPTGESRGAHAHYKLQEFVICLSGSFDIALDDGQTKATIHLNRPWQGLYIPPMIWVATVNFDAGSIYLGLASELYEEADYIRDYSEYLRLARGTA